MTQLYSVTRGSILIATLNYAHSNALNELMIRNGEILISAEIKNIADLRGIDYYSSLRTQAPHLSNEFQLFLKEKFVEHWEHTFETGQLNLIDLAHV